VFLDCGWALIGDVHDSCKNRLRIFEEVEAKRVGVPGISRVFR
jgi:hypothetical protein